MALEISQEQADLFNERYAEGWDLLDGLIFIDGKPAKGRLGWGQRRRLKKAIRCFEQAVQIYPESWQSMWALGKAWQRLGRSREALRWFADAHGIDPTQRDVAREAGITALDLGQADAAVRFCRAALSIDPDNPGLHANLALALVLSGDDAEALACAEAAVAADPEDRVSAHVFALVQSVADGSRKRPTRL